jgi:hypothetical protein
MLVVRDQQMQAMSEALFMDWLILHLRRHFPERCLDLGPEALEGAVASSLQRARGYGFQTPVDLCRFLDLEFAFGPDFGRDDALPWASELLEATDLSDPTERMDLLIVEAKAHVERRARERGAH